ncbi:MAG: DUF6391 domain-containing protein [Anaerolineaceae bacterium]|nr:DUF6391 domain-containing protein [Anaerolineaceae bacterium]
MTKNFLDRIPFIHATRRNHALEHATLTVLAQQYPGAKMAGLSNAQGFFLFADLPTEVVTDAVLKAQKRLLAGEEALAIHPSCGTNMVTSSVLAAGGAWLLLYGSSGARKPKWYNYIFALSFAIPVYIFSQPLGPKVQKTFTTQADLGNLSVKLVESNGYGKSLVHFIHTTC